MTAKIRSYEGAQISVRYDVQRCIHAAECVHGLPQVFDTNQRPWIKPDGASADDVAAVVMRCPTGALQFERTDGGPAEPTPAHTTIQTAPNGPLYMYGNLELMDENGTLHLTDTRVALCRCGASATKPLCDGSHSEIGFQAE